MYDIQIFKGFAKDNYTKNVSIIILHILITNISKFMSSYNMNDNIHPFQMKNLENTKILGSLLNTHLHYRCHSSFETS